MDNQSLLQRMENWGYFLLPKSHPESPGYTGLLVAIHEKPSKMHFDPTSIHLRLCQGRQAQEESLGLRPLVKKSVSVCPGRVILHDRKKKETEFFTFGGSMEVLTVPGETVYSLRSPAPILALTEAFESVANQLAFETEAMLGKLEALWGLNRTGFERRLAQVKATQFYLAVIHALLLRFEESQRLREEHDHFYHFLLNEKEWFEKANEWPLEPPDLEAMFAPD